MAKRRTQIIRASTATPTIRIQAPRAAPLARSRRRGRRRGGSRGAGALGLFDLGTAVFVAKMALEQLGPRLPVLLAEAGPMGSIALLAHFMHANKYVKGIQQVTATIAVYNYLMSAHGAPANPLQPGGFIHA